MLADFLPNPPLVVPLTVIVEIKRYAEIEIV